MDLMTAAIAIGNSKKGGSTDLEYNPNSGAAQSGIAVAQAIKDNNKIIFEMIDKYHPFNIVQRNVRNGTAPALYPIGYEFETLDSNTGNILTWRVVAHNHHRPADSDLKNSMTLEMKNPYCQSDGAYQAMVFSNPEALYYAESNLQIGTYNFTVDNQAFFPEDNGKTFQFTLTKPLPVKGQICLQAKANEALNGKQIETFDKSGNKIETVLITEGQEGISLGITGQDKESSINDVARILFGSNNYGQSSVRQWLNSNKSKGAVWEQQTKFDRPPAWLANYNGFMLGLPIDFLAVVQPAIIPCRTNAVFEVNSLDGTEYVINQVYELKDNFFLLSRPEIFATWDNEDYNDGEILEYYKGLTNSERIKYDMAGSARTCWLRSPTPEYSQHERSLQSTGVMSSARANYNYGIFPACIIA